MEERQRKRMELSFLLSIFADDFGREREEREGRETKKTHPVSSLLQSSFLSLALPLPFILSLFPFLPFPDRSRSPSLLSPTFLFFFLEKKKASRTHDLQIERKFRREEKDSHRETSFQRERERDEEKRDLCLNRPLFFHSFIQQQNYINLETLSLTQLTRCTTRETNEN